MRIPDIHLILIRVNTVGTEQSTPRYHWKQIFGFRFRAAPFGRKRTFVFADFGLFE